MDLSQIQATIPVHSGQPLRLQQGFGRRITVIEGNVWVTQDSDPRDIVLGAGDGFCFDRHADALVSSLGGDARIACEDGVVIGGARHD